MGNSEVGHLNLGSGRVVYQEFTRVNRSIRTGSFFKNRTLTDAVDLALERTMHCIYSACCRLEGSTATKSIYMQWWNWRPSVA